jgi:hypothetical protein
VADIRPDGTVEHRSVFVDFSVYVSGDTQTVPKKPSIGYSDLIRSEPAGPTLKIRASKVRDAECERQGI